MAKRSDRSSHATPRSSEARAKTVDEPLAPTHERVVADRRDGDRGRRVLVVFHEETAGGATASLLRAVPHLEERGWSFHFWVSRPSDLFDQLAAAGYDVEGLPRHIGFSLKWLRLDPGPRRKLASMPAWFRGLAQRIRTVKPSLVHANSVYTFLDALVGRTLGAPTILHSHEMLPTWKGDVLKPAIYGSGMVPIGASSSCAERLRWRGRSPRVVYESAPIPSLRDRTPRTGRPFVVGTIGYVCRRKGTDVFVRAADQLLAERDDIEFHMIGRNDPSPEHAWGEQVLTQAAAAGIHHREHADVFEELQSWDLLVAPSRHDPFPLVVLEAMASAVPVVGSRVDGIAEQVTPETGRLVPVEDHVAFAKEIAALLDDDALRAAMGPAARHRVAANFTPAHQAERIDRIYRELVCAGPT